MHPLDAMSQGKDKLQSFGLEARNSSGERDTGGNSEDSVACRLICLPALLLEA